MMVLTVDNVLALGVHCRLAKRFHAVFPKGMAVTPNNVLAAKRCGLDCETLIRRLHWPRGGTRELLWSRKWRQDAARHCVRELRKLSRMVAKATNAATRLPPAR